jgi:uncharacterized protein YndB with AHSA1/START domain
MAAGSKLVTKSAERELTITRIFDAPRSLVWKAWAEPERMALWAGPKGFTITSCEMGATPGGVFRMSMRSPAGTHHRVRGVYHEIVEEERLVYTWAWVDADGNPGHETLITIRFEDYGVKTRLILHQALFESVVARDDHRAGWDSSLDCLAEYLAEVTPDRPRPK